MKILIIEDEIDILNFLIKSLKAEMFTIDSSDTGDKGLELALENKYDIIILDNNLPNMHGSEICKILREKGNTTPILMLSVRSEIDTKVKLLNMGADDYLTKPFAFDELIARIRALLRRGEKIESEIIINEDLVLDSKKHTVTSAGKALDLTRKEYLLLEYLMRNKDIPLSRGMILEQVWDMNADPFSNTIESHVRSIRKKIEDNHGIKTITTISGMGYKM